MKRAVNVGDLTNYLVPFVFARHDHGTPGTNPVTLMLQPILSHERALITKGNVDSTVVLVREDVPDDQWQAIVTILRNGLGNLKPVPKNRLRLYEYRKGWKTV